MKTVYLVIIVCTIGVVLNLPLMVRNEQMLISTSRTEDGWKMRCVYYKPFELRTVEIPHYQKCEPVRREDTNRRQGTFFWEQKA